LICVVHFSTSTDRQALITALPNCCRSVLDAQFALQHFKLAAKTGYRFSIGLAARGHLGNPTLTRGSQLC
jgi:hypothetical protein